MELRLEEHRVVATARLHLTLRVAQDSLPVARLELLPSTAERAVVAMLLQDQRDSLRIVLCLVGQAEERVVALTPATHKRQAAMVEVVAPLSSYGLPVAPLGLLAEHHLAELVRMETLFMVEWAEVVEADVPTVPEEQPEQVATVVNAAEEAEGEAEARTPPQPQAVEQEEQAETAAPTSGPSSDVPLRSSLSLDSQTRRRLQARVERDPRPRMPLLDRPSKCHPR